MRQRFNPPYKSSHNWLDGIDYEEFELDEMVQKMPRNRKSAAERQITSKRGNYNEQKN